jgi:hypothetical protein
MFSMHVCYIIHTTGSSQHGEIMYYRLFNQGMKKSLKISKMIIRSRNGNIDKLIKRYRYIGMMMMVFNLAATKRAQT